MHKHDSGDAPVATYALKSKKHRYGFPAIVTLSAQLSHSKAMRHTS